MSDLGKVHTFSWLLKSGEFEIFSMKRLCRKHIFLCMHRADLYSPIREASRDAGSFGKWEPSACSPVRMSPAAGWFSNCGRF